MSWEALKLWDKDAKRIKRFADGVANEVWAVTVHGKKAVARLGTRSDEDLRWETELLQFLGQNGICVPTPLQTINGKYYYQGLVVMEHLEGAAPSSADDWKRVAQTIQRVHELTKNWPQRHGWKSSVDLIEADKGTKIDLSQMPNEGLARCRNAWQQIKHRPQSVVHGDLNPGNILISDEKVAFIDWDEARVDVSALDLALPHNAGNLDEESLETVSQAVAAWEAAVCWGDDYSKKRLAEVKPV